MYSLQRATESCVAEMLFGSSDAFHFSSFELSEGDFRAAAQDPLRFRPTRHSIRCRASLKIFLARRLRPDPTRRRDTQILPPASTSATRRPRLLRGPARPLHPRIEPIEFRINRALVSDKGAMTTTALAGLGDCRRASTGGETVLATAGPRSSQDIGDRAFQQWRRHSASVPGPR